MKPSFSFSDALSAPFSVLRRRPLYVFVWGLMLVAVVTAIYSVMLPIFATIPLGEESREAMDLYMQEVSRLSVVINGMNLIMYLVMLALWTAAGRAVLSPGRGDRFLFLRLGMDEVRVAVAIIATFVGWYLALIVLVLLGAGIGLALWQINETTAIGVLVAYGLIVFVASIWALVRVSLIAPASLILKRFAFVEGWQLARGQVWKLIGLNIVIYVIYTLALLAVYAVVALVLFAGFVGQGLNWPVAVTSVADLEPLIDPMIIPGLVAVIPLAWGFGWLMTFYAAPSIVVARQLLDGVPISRDAPTADTLQTQ